jgi:hypothetical protein
MLERKGAVKRYTVFLSYGVHDNSRKIITIFIYSQQSTMDFEKSKITKTQQWLSEQKRTLRATLYT